jgi:hypothetical protein
LAWNASGAFDLGSRSLYSLDKQEFGAAMANSAVEKIGNAIGRLTPQELQELYVWLDQHHPHLASGSMDRAIFRALDDENMGRTQPL